jgi:cyanophycinase
MNATTRRIACGTVALAIAFLAPRTIFAQPPLPHSPAADNPLGLPAKAVASGGSLVICGGGRIPDAVYDEFIRLAGGTRARLVVIPSASAYSDTAAVRDRYAAWNDYQPRSLDILDAKSRSQADTSAFANALADATGVWFGGGMQSRLCDLYAGTRVEVALHAVLERGGVIGGTSAGAAVMSQTMIESGVGDGVHLDRGLGFLSSTIVDQHFTQRNRHTRLLSALGQHPDQIGLGVDEGTAVFVSGNHLRVLGANRATLIVPANDGTTLHALKSTDQIDLVASAHRAPGEAAFAVRRVAKPEGPQRDLRAAAKTTGNSTLAQAATR